MFCPLVEPTKILLKSFHIKLRLTKNFIKALNREGKGLALLQERFPQKSKARVTAGVFDGLHIRGLIKDNRFESALKPVELSAWMSLESIIGNFLGNKVGSPYQKTVDELPEKFHKLEARMSVKMYVSSLPFRLFS